MTTKNENTIAVPEQLTEVAAQASKLAVVALDKKDVDQALRLLEVCKQALELLPLSYGVVHVNRGAVQE